MELLKNFLNKINNKLKIYALLSVIVCLAAITILWWFEKESVDSYYEKVDVVTKNVEETADSNLEEVKDYYADVSEITTVNAITGDYSQFIFVGDSRYEGMKFLAEEDDVFVCERGVGYDFLNSNYYTITSLADENTAVIIGLGVNDNLKTAWEDYIALVSRLEENTDCQIYYMLVNPVDEALEYYSGYSVTNEDIDFFNGKLIEGFDSSIGIIDTNSYLKSVGFETKDGIHYTDETYRMIYEYIKGSIKVN